MNAEGTNQQIPGDTEACVRKYVDASAVPAPSCKACSGAAWADAEHFHDKVSGHLWPSQHGHEVVRNLRSHEAEPLGSRIALAQHGPCRGHRESSPATGQEISMLAFDAIQSPQAARHN